MSSGEHAQQVPSSHLSPSGQRAVSRALEFAREGYDYVPLVLTRPADTLTPVGALLALRRQPGATFLLESVIGGERLARHSFAGRDPLFELRIEQGRLVRVDERGQVSAAAPRVGSSPRSASPGATSNSPWKQIEEALRDIRVPKVEGLPPFAGGAVGYLGYEAVHFVEPRVPMRVGRVPLARLPVFSTVVGFDHLAQHVVLVRWVAAQSDQLLHRLETGWRELEGWEWELRTPSDGEWLTAREDCEPQRLPHTAALGEEGYQRGVRTLKRAIRAGDIFQAVLADRFELEFDADPLWVYRALRSLNPSPYMFYVDWGDMALVGSSPEMLVRVDDREVETRPIAGTRPRGATADEDAKFAAQMLASVKERAEHVMLVDLGRNDIGRVCRGGSVRVPTFMGVERYSHVMHIVSSVTGTLARGKSSWDALASCFPAGTVSGAPKIHAMELLAQIEPVPRGAYAGAVIYRDLRGGLDSAIAIRCLTVLRNPDGPRRWTGHVQAGAGIVYDSNPAAEWREVQNKAGAMMDAIAWAEAARAYAL